jgi:tRNA (guanine6-N2)-methyltransferase
MPFFVREQPCFALTTAGLETLSAQEIALLPHVTVTDVSYRRISVCCSGALAPLLSLRTVDDVFLEVATWTDIGRPRSALGRIRTLAARLRLYAATACCASLRPVGIPPRFSVTVSFVGKRNYTNEEMKAILATEIEKTHGWSYQQDDCSADLNVRIFLEHEVATVGVRLGKTALHDRFYQRAHLPGALKPSVAAGLVLLAQAGPDTVVLDPCCGSGTILIEAALQGATVCGGDNSSQALAAAQANLAAAGIAACIQRWDARTLPLADASMDGVICNLPWGRQVEIAGGSRSALYRGIVTEMRRVLAPAGHMVLLTSAPEEVDPFDLCCIQRLEISLFGQRPSILMFSLPDVQNSSKNPLTFAEK